MSDSVIRRLRRKIVLVSIVAVFLSLLALIFAISFAHYLQVDANLRGALAEIASEDGAGFDAGQRASGGTGDGQLDSGQRAPDGTSDARLDSGQRDPDGTGDARLDSGQRAPDGTGDTSDARLDSGQRDQGDTGDASDTGAARIDSGLRVQDGTGDASDAQLDSGQRIQDAASDGQLPGQGTEDGAQLSDSDPYAARRMEHGGRKSARTQYGSRFFCVFVSDDGDMFVKSRADSELADEDARQLAQSVLSSGKTEGYLDDYKFLVDESDSQKRVFFLDCTTDLDALRQLSVVALIVGGCAFIIASLFTLRLSRLIVRPLEESARKQKRFVADAGHELKTPLSVIATNMDILEEDLADQPEEREWIDSTNRQVGNMRQLVNDLIVLSKMEEREDDVVLSEVSLSDTAYECVQTFSQLAIAQGKELVASIDEDVCVRGDEPAIRQLMQILVDNAIKYATGDGKVLVEVTKTGRSALFATRNDWAHDVDSRELPTLFDRFVRGERSRDRSEGKVGYGLGLSIARAIAENNDFRLEVDEDDAGRIVFRALFPAR